MKYLLKDEIQGCVIFLCMYNIKARIIYRWSIVRFQGDRKYVDGTLSWDLNFSF